MKHGKINIILGKCHGPILRRDTIDLISISDIDFFCLPSLAQPCSASRLMAIRDAGEWRNILDEFACQYDRSFFEGSRSFMSYMYSIANDIPSLCPVLRPDRNIVSSLC